MGHLYQCTNKATSDYMHIKGFAYVFCQYSVAQRNLDQSNTPVHNNRHLADTIFESISYWRLIFMTIQMSLEYIPSWWISALAQVIAWHRTEKPERSSEAKQQFMGTYMPRWALDRWSISSCLMNYLIYWNVSIVYFIKQKYLRNKLYDLAQRIYRLRNRFRFKRIWYNAIWD